MTQEISCFMRRSLRQFTWLGCCTLFLLLIAGAAQAKDMALKFEGTPTANVLTDAAQAAIDDFVADGLAFNQGDFACFEAPLIDLSTGREVGTGVDCLQPSAVDLSDSANLLATGLPDDLAFGLQIEATTFFLLEGGNLVNQGQTSVQPFFPATGNALGAVTHMTGSIPSGLLTGGIQAGTKQFEGWEGARARLSGAVNLGLPNNQIFFSCLFVIERP
jgi:hypothetical protein